MASILDLARRANVSPTTVSRVLNKSSHPVSEAVRLRVLKAAEEIDYRPNALARAMITRRTQIIAVIVGDSGDPYFSTIVRGIEAEARSHGYLVIICNTDRDPLVEQNYLKLLNDYQVDGIIFAGAAGMTAEIWPLCWMNCAKMVYPWWRLTRIQPLLPRCTWTMWPRRGR